MPQQPQDYSPEAHALWQRLFNRQRRLIEDKAHPAFIEGLHALDLSADRIPRFEALSERLNHLSGWTIHAVDGLLPGEDFFQRLAARRFPVTWWLRTPEQADYIVEPDLFHDLMGHLPMLADPAVGDFIQAYGEAVSALHAAGEATAVTAMTRLYWFTVEFGLVAEPSGPVRLYGAGLLSSYQESLWAIEAPRVRRDPADLLTMMRQDYVIDRPQARYFVVPGLAWLWRWTAHDLKAAAREAATLPDWPVAELPE